MTPEPFDRDLLAAHLKEKMREKDLATRAAAEEIGCSAATLARMLQGSKSENFPQGRNLLRAVNWVGKNFSYFEKGGDSDASPLEEVEAHLRAMPELPPDAVDALMAMVRALSDAKTR